MPRANRQKVGVRRSKASRVESTLDALAQEAIARFVRVLARSGGTPDDIARDVAKACRSVPKSWASKAQVAMREVDGAAHVLTLWFSDPAYLDARGHPRPLPVRGGARSIEALMRRVDPHFEPGELVRYLSQAGALRRVGARYVPRERMVLLRGMPGPHDRHHLRGLLGMLRTLEHNTQPKREVPGWFEFIVENPRFPVSARAAFASKLRQRLLRIFSQVDADMHRLERSRRPGEPTMRFCVGVYRFEEEDATTEKAPPRRRKTRR